MHIAAGFCAFAADIMEFKAHEIAQLLGGTVEGNPNAIVSSFSKIEEGKPGSISFLYDPHYASYLYSTKSSVVLVNADFVATEPVEPTLIRVPDARAAIGRLMGLAQKAMAGAARCGIHPQAVVEATAEVAADCYIGPFCYVGPNAKIGAGTQLYAGVVVEENATVGEASVLYPHVSVYHDCHVGNRCILHSGAVIGADGFGFQPTAEGYEKIPQLGNAVIEDDVEIGANACVDRAMMGSTIVHRGAKIDNLVQIAHNVEVGIHTVMSSQVGVAGSAKIGEWCMFGGQVGIAGHITVADRTQSGAQAGIAGTVRRPGTTIIGSPAMDARKFARCTAVFKNLPELRDDVIALQRKAAEEDKA